MRHIAKTKLYLKDTIKCFDHDQTDIFFHLKLLQISHPFNSTKILIKYIN